MNNVTDLTSIRASAVPSTPKTISATQRLAALELAQRQQDYVDTLTGGYSASLHRDSIAILRELAGDAKVGK